MTKISDANVATVVSCSWTAWSQRWPGDLLLVDGSRQRPRLLVRRQREVARVRRLISSHKETFIFVCFFPKAFALVVGC